MKKIIVSDKMIGKCTFEYNKTTDEDDILTQKKELAIKALAGLQLICMTRTRETEAYFDKLIGILQEAIDEIGQIDIVEGEDDESIQNIYN